jgi:hypothetical protein
VPLIAAGIGAAGSVIGGITGGKGAKKAAKINQQTQREVIAANNANRMQIVGMSQPAIDRGNSAANIYSGLLNVGGDPAASAAALNTYRDSTGYRDLLKTGLDGVTSNAYARGMGDSGATMKALQTRGMNIADRNQQQYLGNLNSLIQTGNSAIGNVAGVNTATTNANNSALQYGSDGAQSAIIAGATAQQNALKNLTNIGMNFASSYGGGGGGVTSGSTALYNPTAQSLIMQNPGIF